MAFRVGVTDHGAAVIGVVFDLPGCQTSAHDLDKLVDVLPIADHLQWLRRCGIVREAPDRIDLEIVERVVAADSVAADGEFCFADDLRHGARRRMESGGAHNRRDTARDRRR